MTDAWSSWLVLTTASLLALAIEGTALYMSHQRRHQHHADTHISAKALDKLNDR